MAQLKLALIILVIVVSAAVIGAALGQLFPRSGPIYIVPVALGIGISSRLIARFRAHKREDQVPGRGAFRHEA